MLSSFNFLSVREASSKTIKTGLNYLTTSVLTNLFYVYLTRYGLLVECDVHVVGGVEAGGEGDLEPGVPQRLHSVYAGMGGG